MPILSRSRIFIAATKTPTLAADQSFGWFIIMEAILLSRIVPLNK
jgi:hypothetical protein